MIAVVNVNGSDLYLEPGTRFCPYGFLRWNHTATDALKVNKKDGAFVKTPPLTYEKSLTKKSANAALSESGDLKGEVTIEFKGIEALEHRLEAIDSDSAGKKKDLEDELKQWLPAGTIVKMTTSDGWEGANDPLVAHFTIEVPSYASVTGKLLLIPVCLFQSKQHKTFMHAERKYPVYFAYPFTELDEVSITVPAGFTLESVPAQQDASLKVAKYQAVSQFDGSRLVTQRKLAFNGIYFDLDKYPELKSFFSKVRTGDEQQAVLQGGGARAQKGN